MNIAAIKKDMFDYLIIGSGHEAFMLAAKLSTSGNASVLLLKTGESGFRDTKNWVSRAWDALKYNDPIVRTTEIQEHLSGRKFPVVSQPDFNRFQHTDISRLVYEADLDLLTAAGIDGSGNSTLSGLPQGANDTSAVPYKSDCSSCIAEKKVSEPTDTIALAFAKASKKIGGEVFFSTGPSRKTDPVVPQSSGGRQKVLNCAIDLEPAISSGSLEIIDECSVSSLLLKDDKVIGAEAFISGERKKFFVSKEVIISLGAIQTPKLLMLSGIGPEADVTSHGIKLKCKLEGVGRNLKDHFEVAVKRYCVINNLGFPAENSFTAFKQGMGYLLRGEDFITSERSETRCLLNVDDTDEAPNVQLRFTLSKMISCDGTLDTSNFMANIYPTVLRPQSKGQVTLRSADPRDFPRVDPNYFSHPEDIRLSLASLRAAQEVYDQDALKEHVIPGPDTSKLLTDTELLTFWVNNGVALNQPIGTCRVGSEDNSVVDSCLRVRGIDGLRVVDLSVLPSIIGGDATVSAILLTHRASELILNSSYHE